MTEVENHKKCNIANSRQYYSFDSLGVINFKFYMHCFHGSIVAEGCSDAFGEDDLHVMHFYVGGIDKGATLKKTADEHQNICKDIMT